MHSKAKHQNFQAPSPLICSLRLEARKYERPGLKQDEWDVPGARLLKVLD